MQGENLIVAVDDDGCFTSKVTDFSGRYVKDADKDIIEAVKVSFIEIEHWLVFELYFIIWKRNEA